MRFYTQQHDFYCGIDLHARSMYLCILNAAGEIVLHRNMAAAPEPFLAAIAPYRENLVVGVECIFCWYWLADLCAAEKIEFVLGHALYMKAIHGGKAKNDKIDAYKIASLLRGGNFPLAYVYPSAMRATRDLLRRRMRLMRERAQLLAHVQNTNSQYNLPEIGQRIAYKSNRVGVAERFRDPVVQKSIEVDLALIDISIRPSTIWSSPSRASPSSTMPRSSIACAPCLESARSSRSSSSMRSRTFAASRACRTSSPTLASSSAPRSRPANTMGTPARRSATHS
jgi:hypothetical protein